MIHQQSLSLQFIFFYNFFFKLLYVRHLYIRSLRYFLNVYYELLIIINFFVENMENIDGKRFLLRDI